ncbi:MAG: DUF3501 family protein [Frankiaceae bacterium]|nr:DUF3501 family protein [Arenimonas sp.]
MTRLTRSDLLPLERYAGERAAFRARVIAHKRSRVVALGAHVSLLFEDRLTVQYQVQEMLRIERIFEAAGIQQELDAYNPLIPDGGNLKATMLLEFPDAVERATRLSGLAGIEHRIFAEVEGCDRVFALADEDLARSDADKTSAVHFLRFEFPAADISALKSGASLSMGIDDGRLPARVRVAESVVVALSQDFSG